MKRSIAVAAIAGTVAFMASPASATDDGYADHEVSACWRMASSDGVEGTYEWPQTRVSGGACDAAPKCGETVEYQHDTYWIRDEADEDYLAGLTTLNSPADDAQLEPHGYFSKVVNGGECEPTPTPPVESLPAPPKPEIGVPAHEDVAVLPDTGTIVSPLGVVGGVLVVGAGVVLVRRGRRVSA